MNTELLMKMKACTLGLIRKIEREDLIVQSGYEVYETLSDYVRANYPEFSESNIEHCVGYAMQASMPN